MGSKKTNRKLGINPFEEDQASFQSARKPDLSFLNGAGLSTNHSQGQMLSSGLIRRLKDAELHLDWKALASSLRGLLKDRFSS